MQGPFLDIADEFPDTVFAMIDATEPPLPNTVAIRFAVEQGSYLVGAAAALESATGRIGYIGANASKHIESFRAGFEQGALAADPDVEIVVDLVAPTLDSVGYVSPEIARREAAAMYEQGVDVIFVAAGSSGIGVTEAATALSTETRPLWVIGVDSDQYYDISDTQRAHLLTSMFKGFDVGIHAVVAAYDNGTLVAPSVVEVGLADGAVGYTTTGNTLERRRSRRSSNSETKSSMERSTSTQCQPRRSNSPLIHRSVDGRRWRLGCLDSLSKRLSAIA